MRMGRDVRHNIETSLRGESRYGRCWEGIGAPPERQSLCSSHLLLHVALQGDLSFQWLSLDITVIHEEI